MIKYILEEITSIKDLRDFAELWPKICEYLETELGWSSLASGTMSIIITIGIIVIPGILLILIIKGIWNKLKNT